MNKANLSLAAAVLAVGTFACGPKANDAPASAPATTLTTTPPAAGTGTMSDALPSPGPLSSPGMSVPMGSTSPSPMPPSMNPAR